MWSPDLRQYVLVSEGTTVQIVDADFGWVVIKAPGNVLLATKGDWIDTPDQSLLRYADEN